MCDAGSAFHIRTDGRARSREQPHASLSVECRRPHINPSKCEAGVDERRQHIADSAELAQYLDAADHLEGHAAAKIDRESGIAKRRQLIEQNPTESVQ